MNDLTTLTVEELKQGREETFSEEMLRDIDTELRRREQAQHTPTESLRRWQVERLNQQNAELAAENERLRGLLAQMVGIVAHLLNLNGDDLSRSALEPSDTLSPADLAAIEAAKEATK